MDYLWTYLSTIALMVVGFLLMFIILLQRGRGGGLAGAFGGLGGPSAFGTKAGDVFTKITIVLAVTWVALAGLSGFAMRNDASKRFKGGTEEVSVQSSDSEETVDEKNDEPNSSSESEEDQADDKKP